VAALDQTPSGHDAVGRQVVAEGVGEETVFDEGALVEEESQAVANEEFVLGFEFCCTGSQVPTQGPV
jgi:hypothetical protein